MRATVDTSLKINTFTPSFQKRDRLLQSHDPHHLPLVGPDTEQEHYNEKCVGLNPVNVSTVLLHLVCSSHSWPEGEVITVFCEMYSPKQAELQCYGVTMEVLRGRAVGTREIRREVI